MNDEDLKKLKELIKEEIRPVKDIIEIIKKKVDSHDLFLHTTSENVRSVKEQQSVMNEKLDTMKQILDANTASVITIEKEIKFYADSYKINKHNIERIDSRLSTVEDNLDIKPSEDLIVPHFSSK